MYDSLGATVELAPTGFAVSSAPRVTAQSATMMTRGPSSVAASVPSALFAPAPGTPNMVDDYAPPPAPKRANLLVGGIILAVAIVGGVVVYKMVFKKKD